MNKKIIFFILFLIVGAALIVGGYFLEPYLVAKKQRDTSDARGMKGKIVIGMDNWVGYFPLCSPEMKKRGFVPVGKLTIDRRSKPRQFKNAQGYFLKKFETSDERGKPVFTKGKPLPRINLDGTVSNS